jgi:hypothetical protein
MHRALDDFADGCINLLPLRIDITPDDPSWIGAWWIGFVISGIGGLSVAFIMGCFPRELPGITQKPRVVIIIL